MRSKISSYELARLDYIRKCIPIHEGVVVEAKLLNSKLFGNNESYAWRISVLEELVKVLKEWTKSEEAMKTFAGLINQADRELYEGTLAIQVDMFNSVAEITGDKVETPTVIP